MNVRTLTVISEARVLTIRVKLERMCIENEIRAMNNEPPIHSASSYYKLEDELKDIIRGLKEYEQDRS